MVIYLIFFGISIFLLYISNYTKNLFLKKILIFSGLLMPCILAGVRSLNIGTDVKVYLKQMYSTALSSNSFNIFLNSRISGLRYARDYERGFTILVYCLTKIFKNIQILMFFIEVLIIFPIYFGCKKFMYLKDKIWFCMLVYYFMFYNISLNAMREFIGLSIVFYGICSLITNEKHGLMKYMISFAVGCLFHKSMILSLTVIIVYYLLKNKKNSYVKLGKIKVRTYILKLTLIVCLGIFLLLNINLLNRILYNNDEFNRYTAYYSEFSIEDYDIIKFLPMLILIIVLLKKFLKKYENSSFYIAMFCFAYLIFGQLENVSIHGDRVSDVYKIISVIYFPLIGDTPNSNRWKKITTLIVIIYVICYWYFMFVYKGYNQTIPFIFYKKGEI